MRYKSFTIEHYRAIESPIEINLTNQSLIPLIGVNECGKTTILQAIFAFDSANDEDYDGRHLQNTINLYHTTDNDPLVTAEIEIEYATLKQVWDTVINPPATARQKPPGTTTPAPTSGAPPAPPHQEFPLSQSTYTGSIRLIRNLTSKQYSFPQFSNLSPRLQDALANEILRFMPYILYNDDFQDRPPSTFPIPTPKPNQIPAWLAIYERLFKETNPSYSLFTTAQLTTLAEKTQSFLTSKTNSTTH